MGPVLGSPDHWTGFGINILQQFCSQLGHPIRKSGDWKILLALWCPVASRNLLMRICSRQEFLRIRKKRHIIGSDVMLALLDV